MQQAPITGLSLIQLAQRAPDQRWLVDAALQVPELKLDALILQGVRAMLGQLPHQAFLSFAQVCSITQNQPELYSYLAKNILSQSQPRLAAQVLEKALFRFPTHPELQQQYATCCLSADPNSDVRQRLEALQGNEPWVDAEPFTPPTTGIPGKSNTVDVLVPVYQARTDTLACLRSLLEAQNQNITPHEIIVLDDASPDPLLVNALNTLANRGLVTHIRRNTNLGFIRNMNRGMALHPDRDVVWLNADTRVHGNWLDRLKAVVDAHDDIASATPFTNNGELMSFPEIRRPAPMPSEQELATLDQLANLLNQPAIELPVGCGFCFYQRREAINDVGYLDEATLTRGYGEETDWCLRAKNQGWRHMGATNVFVAHRGGSAFGLEKALRVQQNNRVINQRYPRAGKDYDRFVTADPLRSAREALQNALAQTNDTEIEPVPITLLPTEQLLHNPVAQCWLIADDLNQPGMGQRWLQIARNLRRKRHSAMQTLLIQKTPWAKALEATGAVQCLPEVEGLTLRDTLTLSGVRVGLTTDPQHLAAHHTAHAFNLSLAQLV